MNFFSNQSVGDLISRLQSNDTLAEILGGELIPNIVSFIQCIVFLITISFYNAYLTIIPVGAVCINYIGYYLIKSSNFSGIVKSKL